MDKKEQEAFLQTLRELNFTVDNARYGNVEKFGITPTQEYLEAKKQAEEARSLWVDSKHVYKSPEYNELMNESFRCNSIFGDIDGELVNSHLAELGRRDWIEYRGSEGDHDTHHVVVSFPDINKTIKIDGTYSSYGGDENYDEWYLVEPVEVIKIEYRPI